MSRLAEVFAVNKLKTINLILLLALCLPNLANAQDSSKTFDNIIASITNKEAGWRLKNQTVHQFEDGARCAYFSLEDDSKSTVNFSVLIENSSEAAAIWFHRFSREWQYNFRQKVLKGKIENLADDNYRWEDYNNENFGGVTLRKDKIVVSVGASSKEQAERLAFYIANSL
jgi:hypothetical protein